MTDFNILKNFVLNSNLIESIYAIKGEYEYDNHLNITIKIEEASNKGIIVHPLTIHSELMKNVINHPGNYRIVKIWVGDEDDFIGVLYIEKNMSKWFDSLKNDILNLQKIKIIDTETKINIENLSWHYHHWFECIHPFIDGNGRTGRLILNNIRRVFDLPWLIIKGTPPNEKILIKEHKEYYDSIKNWKNKNKNVLITKL